MTNFFCHIGGKAGHISAHALRAAVQQTVGLLDEYDASLYGKSSPSLKWNVAEMGSGDGLFIQFQSHLSKSRRRLEDKSKEIADGLVDGLNVLDRGKMPMYLSEHGLKRVSGMARVIKKGGADSFTLRSNGHIATVGKETGKRLQSVIGIKRTSIGSVEGRLVGINVSASPRITIVHHVSRKSVMCAVAKEQMEFVKNALGKTVRIYGTLHKNEAGDTIRVTMRDMQMQEVDTAYLKQLTAQISGLPLPDFASTTITEEYLEETRG